MRLGIIADVHANLDALQAVLSDGQERVDQWWFLGDAVGRGPMPVETLRLLREHVRTRHWLVGNHDLYVMRRLASSAGEADEHIWQDHRRQIREARGTGHGAALWRWCRKTWTLARAKLRRVSAGKADCVLVHAALGPEELNAGDPKDSYIFPWGVYADRDTTQHVIMKQQFRRLREVADSNRSIVLIHGHTHMPYAVAQIGVRQDRALLLPIVYGCPQRLDQYAAILLSPGSVGQPRNGDTVVHAAYGILDIAASTFEFRRVAYGSERMRRFMLGRGYALHLVYMLEPGNEHNPIAQNSQWMEWRRTYQEKEWGWEPIVPTARWT